MGRSAEMRFDAEQMPVGWVYHEQSKLVAVSGPDASFTTVPGEEIGIHFKTYPRFPQITLPRQPQQLKMTIGRVLQRRASTREFGGQPMGRDQLATILLLSAGIRQATDKWDNSKRNYPSAGARYPLEVYPIIIKATDLEPGVYHYNVKDHALEFLWPGHYRESLAASCGQPWVASAAVVFAVSAVFARTEIKYGLRGYRYVLLEAGHIVQNFYLVSTAISLDSCSIGGFSDCEIDALLDLDGNNETVVYLFAVGTRKVAR